MSASMQQFVDQWRGNAAGEMKVAQQHFLELCAALGVAPPTPDEAERGTYSFERTIAFHSGRTKRISTERVDVYKKDCFIWENKQGSHQGSDRVGHGRRGTGPWRVAMNQAKAQAIRYALHVEDRAPPFVVVCDVGHEIRIWSDFSRTGKEYEHRAPRVISYDDLLTEEGADTLRKVIADPQALNPATHQAAVTRAVAEHLAQIARSLEADGHPASAVSQFLMRCVFTMFAEDTGLLKENAFTDLLGHFGDQPTKLAGQLEHLWQLMDTGGFALGIGKVLRFNGGLFHTPSALPLSAAQVGMLHDAARHDWSQVEPTIFGTLVERALDPVERHSLGAHFTPRPYIERLVRPAVMDPLRDDWLAVQAEVLDALGDEADPSPARRAKAVGLLRAFHQQLCALKVLDPACGTGNFLYVTYDLLKDLEDEVLQQLSDLGEKQTGLLGLGGQTLEPTQMLGIEKNPRAREIADLVLWIGHLQRQRRGRKGEVVQEPVLRDAGNIECRDAVLAWDGDPVPRRDSDGNVVTVWDMRTTKTDPVTGREVPDEAATVTVFDYPNARPAAWPEADFVVSNPPFVGDKVLKRALGQGYVAALRKAWPHIPASADFVMYWWDLSASLTSSGAIRQFGLISTNSIRQGYNRRVVSAWLGADKNPVSIVHAIPDHPWVDCETDAQVRVSMTVARRGTLVGVIQSEDDRRSGARRGVVTAQLTIGPDLDSCKKLVSNLGVSCPGVKLFGQGFVLSGDEATEVMQQTSQGYKNVVRPYLTGGEIVRTMKGRSVIDFRGLSWEEAEQANPAGFHRIVERVKPERLSNRRRSYRENWWLFGEPRKSFRTALAGLRRYIGTPETSKHRLFVFVDAEVVSEGSVIVVAHHSSSMLGILSSGAHTTWSLAAGARLGVGNDPRYTKTKCFDPFPFPDLDGRPTLRDRIGDLAERLDAHRKSVQAKGRVAGKQAHLTNQYNALERAREARAGGAPLTDKERAFHEGALIGILQNLHDELDAAVAEAYGWPADLEDEEILERLVALNHERAAEEAQGKVRWLRPEFQDPDYGKEPEEQVDLDLDEKADPAPPPAPAAKQPWPKDPAARLLALRDLARSADGPLTADAVRARFKGARKAAVVKALDTLAALGALVEVDDGAYVSAG